MSGNSLGKVAVLAAFATFGATTVAAEPIPEYQMGRYCQGEASAEFGISPQAITMGDPWVGGAGNTNVEGESSGPGAMRFECRFDPQGNFMFVRARPNAPQHGGGSGPTDLQIQACNAVEDRYGQVQETTPLKPGAWEIILMYNDGAYVCNVEADNRVTYFEKLR